MGKLKKGTVKGTAAKEKETAAKGRGQQQRGGENKKEKGESNKGQSEALLRRRPSIAASLLVYIYVKTLAQ